jgi:hypothetical protein
MTVSTIQERAAALFSYLVFDDEKLQIVAVEGDAIPKLAHILTSIRQTDIVDTTPVSNIIHMIRSSTNDKLYEV